MKKREIKRQSGSIKKKLAIDNVLYTPENGIDTFMSCISFWYYGTVRKRCAIRRILLLHFAMTQFGCKFKSVKHIVRQYWQDNLESQNPETWSVDKTIEFILVNEESGVISCTETMCQIVASYFRVNVYVRGKKVAGPVKQRLIGTIGLEYSLKNKKFSLLVIKNFKNVRMNGLYRVCVTEKNNEWTDLGNMKRVDMVNQLEVVPAKKNQLYTIIPLGMCYHKHPLHVYLQKQGSETCQLAAIVEKGKQNPYFFIKSMDPTNIIAVCQSTENDAEEVLRVKNKLTVVKCLGATMHRMLDRLLAGHRSFRRLLLCF